MIIPCMCLFMDAGFRGVSMLVFFFFTDILDPLMLPLFNDNRYICFDYHRIDIASQNLVVSWPLTEVLLKSTL